MPRIGERLEVYANPRNTADTEDPWRLESEKVLREWKDRVAQASARIVKGGKLIKAAWTTT